MSSKKVKKKKFKWKVILKLFLFLIFLGCCYFYIGTIPTKHIFIKGANNIIDNDIILAIGYKNYPKLFSKSKKEIEDIVSDLDFVDKVKVSRSLLGVLKIDIKEANPLFLNRSNNKIVLSNEEEITRNSLNGIPVLINSVPDTYYKKLIEKLNNIDKNVRNLISEIEYQPWKSNDVMIDETRFFLRMNDGNSVYVNLIHMDKLNNYIEIFASIEGKLGTLYLDSSSDKISFSEYKVGDVKDEDKLQQNDGTDNG